MSFKFLFFSFLFQEVSATSFREKKRKEQFQPGHKMFTHLYTNAVTVSRDVPHKGAVKLDAVVGAGSVSTDKVKRRFR